MTMKTFIIPTSKTERLANRIEKKIKSVKIIFPDLDKNKKRVFPDKEIYMKISKARKLKNKKVIVLHSGSPEPNRGLVELELILQILKDNDIKPEVFFTYFPYSMQDKVFGKGETNVAENLVEKLVEYYKVNKIYIIDPHFGKREWVLKYPINSLSAVPYLVKKAWQDFNENILFLSPDKGGKRRTGLSGVRKERLDSFKVRFFSPKINFKGEIVGVVDDLIETGGTLLKFYEFAKKRGAKKVIALITHGVLPVGVSKIKKNYSKLYLTNTIEQKETNVDITDLILKNIK